MNKAMCVVGLVVLCACARAAGQSNPWADRVVSYVPGSNATPGYTTAGVALGEPTRFTGVSGGFPGAVTPFNAAWEPGEIVSIGEGGELIVRFDEPVLDDPLNPFGIDLLVFGNAWYVDTSWPSGIAGGVVSEGGVVSVSVNGSVWIEITGVQGDGAFPTLGYLDLSDPYATSPGSVLSDFTRPVDPAFDATGRTFAQIVSAYGGSGGGVGIDLGAFGLSAISYVRVSNPVGSGLSPEIDAFADVAAVPSPGVLALLACGLMCGGVLTGRRSGWSRSGCGIEEPSPQPSPRGRGSRRRGPSPQPSPKGRGRRSGTVSFRLLSPWERKRGAQARRGEGPLSVSLPRHHPEKGESCKEEKENPHPRPLPRGEGAGARLWRRYATSACAVALCCAGSRAQSAWTHLARGPGRVSIASSVQPSLAQATWIMGHDAGGAAISFVGQAGVVADESRVYAVGEVNGVNKLFAIDRASGAPAWSATVAPSAFESWSTPAIDLEHRTVIVASGNEVAAFDCASGSRVWTAALARPIVNASPVVTDDLGPTDRVFITDYDGFGAASRLYCINIDPRDATANPFEPGEIVWSVAIGRATGSTPAYRNGIVYVATAGDGLSANGRVLAYPAGAAVPPPPLWAFTNPTPAPFVGGVSVRADGAGAKVYAASYSFSGGLDSGNLVKLNAATGNLVWSIAANRTASIPLPLADGRIVLCGGIMGFGSAPSVELFEDLGSSARRVWNTALDTWVDTNGNGVMEPGEFLLVGGWTTQPIATGAGVLLVGAVPATGASFGACTDLYAIDLSRRPAESSFVLESFAGAGSSPAAVAGALYTVGREGVHAFGTCYADCDRSTGAGKLDIFDFLCFQSSFVSGESYACQCDVSTGAGVCDLFDFLCFQNAFVAGCP